jgi:chromosome segregation ATPase
MLDPMKSTCLSVCRQGWLGIPLFLLGVVSLAFSQLGQEPQGRAVPPGEMAQFVSNEIGRLKARVSGLQRDQSTTFLADRKQAIAGNLSLVSKARGSSDPIVARLQANLQSVEQAWKARSSEGTKGLATVEGRLLETEKIFKDLDENFAGRMEEAQLQLDVLRENLTRTENELIALAQLSQNARSDALAGFGTLLGESNELVKLAVPQAPLNPSPSVATNRTGSAPSRFSPSIRSSVGQVGSSPGSGGLDDESIEAIRRLKNELAASKSVQTELSADTAGLQGDLRKAYREIVTLQANLNDSQMLVDELEVSKKSLWKTEDGGPPTAQTVSRQINRLERELEKGRDDLRLSRQTLLLEQQRSNAMISSVTTELERTRDQLDSARTAAASSGADSGRLLALERELNQASRALQMAQTAPKDKTQESYLTLQDELRKAFGEITRMQIELADKEVLEEQLNKLRNSIDTAGDLTSGTARAEYVNKVLIELNDVKREVVRARAENREERKNLTEKVAALEDELQATKIDLEKTRRDFLKTREGIAKREFEDALTIQKLEEEAEFAQSALREASLGKLPAIPFVNEMEEGLANSEARVKALAERFDAEQAKATEVIDGLRVELDSAMLRQKRALDQLSRREIDLQGKERDLQQVEQDKKKLNEELEVVKVIASQLQDLNGILEKTKDTQNSQSGSMDDIIKDMREQLNNTKVDLVFSLEDRERLQKESSKRIKSLEGQLENTRKELHLKEENLADLASGSEELMLDLRSELDTTRAQISRMKRAGMGGTQETEKAISQLQEALGTIRILQESLDEAEQVNLEVDTLRADLANAMETQMADIQRSEDEKKQLHQKAKDLETEIAMLRDQRQGTGVGFQKLNAQLREQLEASQTQVAELEVRAAKAEDSGITSLVQIEDELAQAKNRSQELLTALEDGRTGKNRTIELLEKDLARAEKQLKELGSFKETLEKSGDDQKEYLRVAELERELSAAQIALDEAKQKNTVLGDRSNSLNSLKGQLEDALAKLDAMQRQNNSPRSVGSDPSPSSFPDGLEKDLAKAQETISTLQISLDAQEGKRMKLQQQLADAMDKLSTLKDDTPATGNDAMDFFKLEEELAVAKNTISEIQNKADLEKASRMKLEKKLEVALGQTSPQDTNLRDPSDEGVVENLKQLLAEKEAKQEELEKQLNDARELADEKEAELELAKALNGEMEEMRKKLEDAQKGKGDLGTPPSPMPETERIALQGEIDQLKKLLAEAKDSIPNQTGSENFSSLQTQLQDAVAESVEMQTELEETKRRLAAIEAEDIASSGQQSPELQKVIANAKNAEQQGQLRVAELTQALRESESLRKEMEGLLVAGEQAPSQPAAPNIAADPRFIEIQKEMLFLQQDLLAARNLEDPQAGNLQAELASAQADNLRLNEEFKNALEDFGRIKEKLALLEDENQRLQTEGISNARTKAERDLSSLQAKIGGLSSENSNLRVQLGERENRIAGLRDELARAQVAIPGIMPDNAALRAQIIRLEGMAQTARDGEGRAQIDVSRTKADLQAANQKIVALETSLRQAESMARNLPQRMPSLVAPIQPSYPPSAPSSLSNVQIVELNRLKEQNQRLQAQLQSMSSIPGRDQIDRKISTLNQQNLTAQIQLDQERARVEDLRKQLSEARDIKQEVLERGQSANLKVGLMNDQLADAKERITSLENALLMARDAIRILKKGNDGSTVKVSVPSDTFSTARRTRPSTPSTFPTSPRISPRLPARPSFSGGSPLGGIVPRNSSVTPFVHNIPKGDASLQLSAQVQFLNNKNRPAGYTEFFLLQQDFDSIMKSSRIRIPAGQDIDSFAELWARSIQRGYRFPGVAAAIRNALASASLARIKTNSVGRANLGNLKSGKYFVVGASTLGQVGVVWSKRVSLSTGSNGLSLDLRDAEWAE